MMLVLVEPRCSSGMVTRRLNPHGGHSAVTRPYTSTGDGESFQYGIGRIEAELLLSRQCWYQQIDRGITEWPGYVLRAVVTFG